MITLFVDNDDSTTMIIHIDDEFFYYLANYLKLGNLSFGQITPSELQIRVKDLPHEWLLQQPEKKQILNGKEIIVKTKFTEQYIKELKIDLLRMALLAEKKKCLIRWE
jgi:hypothetical protein